MKMPLDVHPQYFELFPEMSLETIEHMPNKHITYLSTSYLPENDVTSSFLNHPNLRRFHWISEFPP